MILRIFQNSKDHNPREWDNLGTMALFHGRYGLGDSNHNIDSRDYSSFEEMKRGIASKHGDCIILPIYMYDHSGITISTEPFSCPWDSGQIGFIFASKKKVREEFGWKKLTAKRIEQIESYLLSEVETYDQYLRGEVYSFNIEDSEGNHVDSCGGFFGTDWETNGIKEHLPEEVWDQLEDVEVEY